MGKYLDQLHTEFDELQNGITAIVDRAADESRDVTDDESKIVERDKGRLTELEQAIKHYTEIESTSDRVAAMRGRVSATPRQTNAGPAVEDAYDINREFPTIGDYAVTVHRAMVQKDPAAIEAIERATAHQKVADNPGLIPRPILGPVINLLDKTRPFINSITNRALPAGQFDRPIVTQHVTVAEQAAEKDLTASQKMVIGAQPVTAHTFAGHLNISRQDIKWSNPNILQLVFEDFAAMYAVTTCDFASDAFVTSLAGNVAIPIADRSGGAVMEALYAGSAAALTGQYPLPDTLWVAPDVWGALGGMTNGTSGAVSFPTLSVGDTSGNPLGLKLVVEPHFAAGTMISGPSSLAEWYEDVDGLLQVGEPDVLGQLVGYAGFGAYVTLSTPAFTKYTMPAPVAASASTSGK